MSQKPHVVGYRRVLDGNSCRFCAVASTQRYHKADLMPLHPGCGCGVAPLVGTHDPGRVLNRELLAKMRRESPEDFLRLVNGPHNDRRDWDRFGFVDRDGRPVPKAGKAGDVDLDAIRAANRDVRVVEHGELGPTLVSDRHDRDRPADTGGAKAQEEVAGFSGRGVAGGGGGSPPGRRAPAGGFGDEDDAARWVHERAK